MKERPILFSGAMVKAILDGRKTQTRRVVKQQPEKVAPATWVWMKSNRSHYYTETAMSEAGLVMRMKQHCPYGISCDRLWVRETWQTSRQCDDAKPSEISEDSSLWYTADWMSVRRLGRKPGKTRPSIFMPRWASRLTLEVIDVKVERVQDITLSDAIAEGMVWEDERKARASFTGMAYQTEWWRNLWDSINAKRGFGWSVNPLVWVVEFRKLA